jgi:hypothetical protein
MQHVQHDGVNEVANVNGHVVAALVQWTQTIKCRDEMAIDVCIVSRYSYFGAFRHIARKCHISGCSLNFSLTLQIVGTWQTSMMHSTLS